MTDNDRYLKELEWHLRTKGVPAPTIEAALAELAPHARRRQDLAAEFGSPQEYAATFEGDPAHRSTFWPSLGGVLAIAWVLGATAAVHRFDYSPPVREGAFVWWPALGLLVAALIVGFLLSWRGLGSAR